MVNPYATTPTRQRNAILLTLLGLSVAAWALIIWQNAALSGGGMMGLTMGLDAPIFLSIWVVMMVAMMFPSAAPMILTFSAISNGKRRQGQAAAPTWLFVGGYLLIWTCFGALAFVVATIADGLGAQLPWLATNGARLGGAALVCAGLYQLSPLKSICLTHCRTPTQFILTSWRDGSRGALRMGMEHGTFCLGCCWWLMVILFPLGLMNVAAMGMLTALIFAEKVLPVGRIVSWVAAAALIVFGALVIIIPGMLPGSL